MVAKGTGLSAVFESRRLFQVADVPEKYGTGSETKVSELGQDDIFKS